jgi:uncharacterized protein YsxB (DUF464 family)
MLEAEHEVALADEAEAEGHREAEEDSVVHQEVVAAGVSVVLREVVDVVDLVAHQEAHQEDEEVSEVEGSDVELLFTRARSMIWRYGVNGPEGQFTRASLHVSWHSSLFGQQNPAHLLRTEWARLDSISYAKRK